MKKRTRSEAARIAAIARWQKVSKKDRSAILSKIAKKGAKARWDKHRKLSTGSIARH